MITSKSSGEMKRMRDKCFSHKSHFQTKNYCNATNSGISCVSNKKWKGFFEMTNKCIIQNFICWLLISIIIYSVLSCFECGTRAKNNDRDESVFSLSAVTTGLTETELTCAYDRMSEVQERPKKKRMTEKGDEKFK